MKVLVTGGTGSVGLAIAEWLGTEGIPAVLYGTDPLPAIARISAKIGRASVVIGDVRERSALVATIREYGVTHVVHAAAITPDEAMERRDPARIIDVNTIGTLAAVASAAECRLPRTVLVSSVAVYGFGEPAAGGFFSEDQPTRPTSLYGISKVAAEQAALRYASLVETDVRILRLGPVFGPWEQSSAARPRLSPHLQALHAMRSGECCVLPRPMAADWLYSRDIGPAVGALLSTERLGEAIFNLGGGAVGDVAAWCRYLQDRRLDFRWRFAGDGERPTVDYGLIADRAPLSNARLEAGTSYRHRFGGERAFDDYFGWWNALADGEEDRHGAS